MATRYLNPGLATGSNDGTTEANAWQSWAACISGLNSAFPNISTAGTAESVDVIVLGGSGQITAEQTLNVQCDAAHPLRFIADPTTRTPGVWDTSKPTLVFNPSSSIHCILFSSTASAVQHVEFHFMNLQWNQTYNGVSATVFFGNYTGKLAGGDSKLVLKGCYAKAGTHTGSNAKNWWNGESNYMMLRAENCIFEDSNYSGSGAFNIMRNARPAVEGLCEYLNCTFVNTLGNSTSFVDGGAATTRVLNCLFVDHAFGFNGGGTAATGSGKNASNAASGLPGSDNTHSITATGLFVSSTNRHLSAVNTWGAGPADGTYGSYVPTTDIDGDTRSGSSVCAGADEYAPPAITHQPIRPYLPLLVR